MLLVALGTVPPRLLVEAGQAVREVLGVAPRTGPALDRPQYAFNKERNQFHTAAILRRLAGLRPGTPVVGLAGFDLFVPDAPFVFGDADRDAGAAIFSVARLACPDPDQMKRRVQAEAVHEVGHLLGLSHCADWRCAMFVTRDAADADRKGPALCAACRTALGG